MVGFFKTILIICLIGVLSLSIFTKGFTDNDKVRNWFNISSEQSITESENSNTNSENISVSSSLNE